MQLRKYVRHALTALFLGLGASSAHATWSIVAFDRATGEVAVVSATCLENFNLIRFLPVVVVGKGGAAAQSFIDTTGQNRQVIFDALQQDATPEEILALLEASDNNHETRQYGIAGLGGIPATFTGTGAGLAATGVIGRIGTIEYAIQGNVLAGDAVVDACEDAFRTTEGDLSQRAMAGMQAARFMGGDGRCSCSNDQPTSCGTPPPNFDKSSHTAFIVVARLGDTDGVCDTQDGCASGQYFLRRRAVGSAADPDPMIELSRRYARWRDNKSVLADHYLTEVTPSATSLPADGVTMAQVSVRLVNLNGVALDTGGQTLVVTDISENGPLAVVGNLVDNGDGTHSFDLTAGVLAGDGVFRIEVQSGNSSVRLFPDLMIEFASTSDLHAGRNQLSASGGEPVPFTLQRPNNEAGRLYRILASETGTQPGTLLGNTLLVPLNQGRLLRWSLDAGPPVFTGAAGALDDSGRATAVLDVPPMVLAPFIGSRLDFCAVLGPLLSDVTDVTGFEIVP